MHECVVCGCACYCHGDIDDCQVETREYASANCEGCGCYEDADFEEFEIEDAENSPPSQNGDKC